MSFRESVIDLAIKVRKAIMPVNKHLNDGSPVNFDDSKVIHLIKADDFHERNIALFIDQIRKNRRDDAFVIISEKSFNDHEKVDVVSKSNLTLFGAMKPELKQVINSVKGDLILSYLKDYNLFDELMLCNLGISFRAGIYDSRMIDMFDLTIKSQSNELIDIFENFEFYLNKLNINK